VSVAIRCVRNRHILLQNEGSRSLPQGIDVVFNYGLFSFDIPNFALRFSLGETDYRLGVIDYPHFAGEYAYFGRSVWQQTLNLNNEEKEAE